MDESTGRLARMSRTGAPSPPRQRRMSAAAAGVAAIIAIVFATIGDGVEAQAQGWAGAIAAYGHTAVWALLAAAFGVAAALGRWQRLSGGLALAALALYLTFVAVVLST